MSIFISKYTTFDELRYILKDIAVKFIIIPTSQDSDWLLDLADHNDDSIFTGFKSYVWNDLYREFVGRVSAIDGKVFRQIDPPDNRLILRHIVDGFIRENTEVTKELPGIIYSGFMDMLSESIRELISEEVSPRILETTVSNSDLSARILPDIYREYLDYLDQNGLMDSAQIPTRTRELIDGNRINIKGENFSFIGFLSFTNAQKNLIESMSNKGANVKLIQPEAYVSGIYDASVQFAKYKTNDNSLVSDHKRDYYLYTSPDILCELDLIARDLALWSQNAGVFAGQPFMGWDSIGVLTSSNRIKTIRNALSRYNIPVNVRTGKKVSETPLGYLPEKIYGAYRNGWQTKDTAILLAHACFGGDISEPEVMYRGPVGERGWLKFMSDSQNAVGMKAFNAMNRFCKIIDKGGKPVVILKALFDLSSEKGLWLDSLLRFTVMDERGVFDTVLREQSSAMTELERKLLFMKELQPSIGIAGNRIFKSFAAMEYISQWAEESQITTSPDILNAVTIYSKIPSLANFNTLIITGVTAKEWPGNLQNMTIISDHTRERINENLTPNALNTHLMTIHEKRIQKEAILKRLFYSASRFIVISRPLTDEKNRPLSESPNLASALCSEDFVSIGTINKSYSDFLPGNSPYFDKIEISSDCISMKKRDVPVGFSENNNKIKISALDELAECPFYYWAKNIEKIREPATELYNNIFAGNFVHGMMEAAWKEKQLTNKNLSSIICSLWDKIENNDNQEISFQYKELFSDQRLIRRKNLLRARTIKSAELQDEIEERINSHGKKRLDMKFEYEISFEVEEFNFVGRCDRLDICEDGAAIIDYKTGKIPKNVLQLGTYAKALTMNGVEFIGAGYISLTEEKLSGVFNIPYSLIYTGREIKKSIEELLSETEREISSAVKILRAGEFKPSYNSQLCRYCSYKPICRYAEFEEEE